MECIIRQALESEDAVLTSISFAAKRHWNYPESYYKIWEKELIITKAYISENMVFTIFFDGAAVGFYSIVENPKDFWSGNIFIEKGYWLEHLFILPSSHHLGFGRNLMQHAKKVAVNMGISSLRVFVDPLAKGFYDKLGAIYLRESPSSIEGRMIPVYEIKIESSATNPSL